MELRRATEIDADTITALVRAAYAPWVAVMGREPMPMRFDYRKAVADTVIDLLEDDGGIAGLVQMRPAVHHLDLINIAVSPDRQGRGIGRALMSHVEETALRLKLGEIRLFTNKLMVSNQRLYTRLGYTIDGEEPFRGGAVVHMSKRLPSAPSSAA